MIGSDPAPDVSIEQLTRACMIAWWNRFPRVQICRTDPNAPGPAELENLTWTTWVEHG